MAKNAKRPAKLSTNTVAQGHFLIIEKNVENIIQSNPVNTDTNGTIESVPKRVEFRKKIKGFLPPGTKQTVRNNEVSFLSRCPQKAG